ncbi:MAG TPA: 3-oxoacyl-[acyl-carrier-protein] synthase III C-terminal domain-containing protein [Clostridium sp.]
MKLIEKANMTLDNIDWFIPHIANMRVIQELCTKMDFPIEKTLSSIERFGNTSSASIPIALWMALEDNKIKKGDILL